MNPAKDDLVVLSKGTVVLSILMLVICACIGQFNFSMFVSVLLSTVVAIVNLILLYYSVASGMEKEPKHAQTRITTGYLLRLLMMGAVIVLGMTIPFFNVFGVVLPLLFPKLVLFVHILKRKGGRV